MIEGNCIVDRDFNCIDLAVFEFLELMPFHADFFHSLAMQVGRTALLAEQAWQRSSIGRRKRAWSVILKPLRPLARASLTGGQLVPADLSAVSGLAVPKPKRGLANWIRQGYE